MNNYKFKDVCKILTLFGMLIFLIVSCSKDNSYDWKKLEPGTQTITGPDSIKGNDITQYQYLAIPRGGSKFNWTVLSGPLEIITNTTKLYSVEVKGKSLVDTVAYIRVEEVTYGGKAGVADTFKVYVGSFCPYNISQLVGDGKFTCKYIDFAPYPVNITVLAGDTLLVDNFFGMGWPVKFSLSKDENEKLTLVASDNFEYNGEAVEIKGEGNYNTCKSDLKVNFAVLKLNGDTVEDGSGISHFYKE